MKAHRDDAAARQQQRQPLKKLAIGMTVLLTLVVVETPIAIDPGSPPGVLFHVVPKLHAAEQESLSDTAIAKGHGVARLSWDEPNRPAATAPRQTSFNDDNYRPRSDVNVMPAPAAQYWNEGLPRYAQPEPIVRQEPWVWLGADGKRQQGKFEWVERNGAIDYASVCRNYRRGSIPYRDCRKGAKRAFAQICSRYKPACHAANNFMP